MKVVILAGGYVLEYQSIPKHTKPMIQLNGKPIIEYIINHYVSYGFKISIALGYKGNIIKRYFKNYHNKN